MRVAAIQMNSGADLGRNLELAGELLSDAARDGCILAVLPENFALMPERGRDKSRHAEQPGEGPIQDFLAECAARHGMWVIAGSMPLESPEPKRVYGACVVVDERGKTRAIYRKIHLFDVDLPDTEESYRESHSMYPGDEPMTVETPAGCVGLTICYDLRFPELYRTLVAAGAHLSWIRGDAYWRNSLRETAQLLRISNQGPRTNCARAFRPSRTGACRSSN